MYSPDCARLEAGILCGSGSAREANWLWDCRSFFYAAILILYGIIPTFQTAHFGRVYAAYGGMFIVLSLLWGWAMDGMKPDRFDIMGGAICLVGMAVIIYAPRG